MHKGYLIAAVILLALSLTCIITTAVEVILGKTPMHSVNFWGALAFHVATAVVAACLLAGAHRTKPTPQEEP